MLTDVAADRPPYSIWLRAATELPFGQGVSDHFLKAAVPPEGILFAKRAVS
jgi:hypothetical protein